MVVVRDPHIPGYECHNLGLVISKTPDNRGLILFLNNPKRPEAAVGLRGMLTRAYSTAVRCYTHYFADFAVIQYQVIQAVRR